MIFNSEAEIKAYYQGRLEEADRWSWWTKGTKWCGVRPQGWSSKGPIPFNGNEVRSLQDVQAELNRQRDELLKQFRARKL